MAVFGPFSGPRMAISCQKRRPCYVNVHNVSRVFCVFSHLTTPHNTHTLTTTRISLCFLWFSVFFHTHTPHNIHTHRHTRTHTCTPATDRDLESGLSKSNARKNQRKCLKKRQSQGNPWRRLVSIWTGKSFVCGEVAKDQSNHLAAGSLRSFPHFQEKTNDLWNRKPCCSRPILKLEMGKILCLLPLNLSSKW